MPKNVIESNNAIKKKIERVKTIVMNIASPQIFQDIQDHYNESIEAFYDDYNPTVYDRTGNLYLASSGSNGIKGNVMKIKNGFAVGIAVDGSYIEEKTSSPYFHLYKGHGEADTKLIFKNAFVTGSHGNKLPHFGYYPKIMKPSPKKLMDEWFFNYCNKEFKNIVDSAVSVALKQI